MFSALLSLHPVNRSICVFNACCAFTYSSYKKPGLTWLVLSILMPMGLRNCQWACWPLFWTHSQYCEWGVVTDLNPLVRGVDEGQGNRGQPRNISFTQLQYASSHVLMTIRTKTICQCSRRTVTQT